jgi:PIN domain nuclease of toxin-antitoxin system
LPKPAAKCGASSRETSPDGGRARYTRAIWYVFIRQRLSQNALQFIRRALDSGKPVYISAISLIETIYLIERSRIPFEAMQRLEAGLKDPASGMLVAPVDEDVAEAVHKVLRNIVPDMPDRIIAATALHLGLPLITRDQQIQSAGINTIW